MYRIGSYSWIMARSSSRARRPNSSSGPRAPAWQSSCAAAEADARRPTHSEGSLVMTPEEKLASLGLVLPEVPVPVANYVPYRWAGHLLYLSGQGPKRADGTYRAGRLGRDATIDDG